MKIMLDALLSEALALQQTLHHLSQAIASRLLASSLPPALPPPLSGLSQEQHAHIAALLLSASSEELDIRRLEGGEKKTASLQQLQDVLSSSPPFFSASPPLLSPPTSQGPTPAPDDSTPKFGSEMTGEEEEEKHLKRIRQLQAQLQASQKERIRETERNRKDMEQEADKQKRLKEILMSAIKLLTDQRDSLLSELNEIKQEKSSLLLELQQVKSRSSEFIAQLSSASSLLQDYRLTSQHKIFKLQEEIKKLKTELEDERRERRELQEEHELTNRMLANLELDHFNLQEKVAKEEEEKARAEEEKAKEQGKRNCSHSRLQVALLSSAREAILRWLVPKEQEVEGVEEEEERRRRLLEEKEMEALPRAVLLRLAGFHLLLPLWCEWRRERTRRRCLRERERQLLFLLLRAAWDSWEESTREEKFSSERAEVQQQSANAIRLLQGAVARLTEAKETSERERKLAQAEEKRLVAKLKASEDRVLLLEKAFGAARERRAAEVTTLQVEDKWTILCTSSSGDERDNSAFLSPGETSSPSHPSPPLPSFRTDIPANIFELEPESLFAVPGSQFHC
uniref:Uncharacterized protein n=1 Tax=Hanusia phi TaxID=3032 RepID=A0A7S0I399_9CRYP|mmetsp:Transcript_9023/g.20689  ORF Transcript_9023/g.20689 Transcript_9023/m.20689 type:complete len:569 (+) Transcript_9023:2-1708(+)